MAVNSGSLIDYWGNGSTALGYVIPFKFFSPDHLEATVEVGGRVIATLRSGEGFVVTQVGTNMMLKTIAPVAIDRKIVIRRNTPLVNEFEWSDASTWRAETLEQNFDWTIMAAADANRRAEEAEARSLRAPSHETVNLLPVAEERKDTILGFDSAGHPIVVAAGLIQDAAYLQSRLDDVEHAAQSAMESASSAIAARNAAQSAHASSAALATDAANSAIEAASFANALMPLGVFPDDPSALASGVKVGQIYKRPSGQLVWRQKTVVTSVALIGDSITEQGGSQLRRIQALGYWSWARAFGGSRWDPVPNGNYLDFATSGARTDFLISTQPPALLASGASLAIDQSGVNDCVQGVPDATIVANRLHIWKQCESAGIQPLALSITPIPSAASGNAGGILSQKVARVNEALRLTAIENNIPFFDYAAIMETTSGSGIANVNFTQSATDIHPNIAGAAALGRELARFLDENFQFTYNPRENVNFITSNVILAGSGAPPTSWGITNLGGGVINSQSRVDGGEYHWWQIDLNGPFYITNVSANVGGSPAGKIVDAVAELEVVSGSFWAGVSAQVYESGPTITADDLFVANVTPYPIVSSDGNILLRTPKMTIPSAGVLVTPLVYVRGTGVIRLRRMGIRSH
mgnify:CR=1 FL=1